MAAVSKSMAKSILKNAGSGKIRVSESAAEELAEALNKYAYSVAKKAVKLSAHARRRTIKRADVALARAG